MKLVKDKSELKIGGIYHTYRENQLVDSKENQGEQVKYALTMKLTKIGDGHYLGKILLSNWNTGDQVIYLIKTIDWDIENGSLYDLND